MTSLPPNVIASVLQAPLQQRQVHQARSAGDGRESEMSRAIARAAEQHEDLIETADADTRVNADGGGSGSQGRAFGEQAQPGLPDEGMPQTPPDAPADGQPHIDITA